MVDDGADGAPGDFTVAHEATIAATIAAPAAAAARFAIASASGIRIGA